MTTTLTHSRSDYEKQALLVEHIGIVQDCLATSRTATAHLAQALAVIHDEELYLLTHGTFEQFCAEQFEMSRSRAYQLLDFAKVVEHISANNCGHLAIPERESHARLLAALPPAQQIEAARLVQETLDAEGRSKPMAADFANAVRILGGNVEATAEEDLVEHTDADFEPSCKEADWDQTPEEICREIIQAIPWPEGELVLEPFSGDGNFYNNLPQCVVKDWCEIRKGRDFFEYQGPQPHTIITNPPFRDKAGGDNLVVPCLERCLQVAQRRVVYFVNHKVFNALTPGRLAGYKEWGWGMTHLSVWDVKKWFGRYYLIVWEKGEPSGRLQITPNGGITAHVLLGGGGDTAQNEGDAKAPDNEDADLGSEAGDVLDPATTADELLEPGRGLCEWNTPDWLFQLLDSEFHFTLDAAALPINTKCKKFFTPEDDGRKQTWAGEIVWCNPPFNREVIGQWVQKAYEESQRGAVVVMVLPTPFKGYRWWRQYCIKGQVRFIHQFVTFTQSEGDKKARIDVTIIVFGDSYTGAGRPIVEDT